MRSSNATLPSITFVLSQEQPATTRSGKRRGKFGTRRTKSSSSFTPHPPRYPPRLDSEFLKTVDYRFSNPPRAPSRSSFALPKDIFDEGAEIEIVVPPPIESEPPSTTGSMRSTATGGSSAQPRSRTITTFVQGVYCALRSRWRGMQAVRREEHSIPIDLCS